MKYIVDISSEVTTWCHASLEAPTELTLLVSCPDEMILFWTINSDNEDGFIIQRSEDNITWTEIDTVGAEITTFTDTTIVFGVTYYYRVIAYNSLGESNYSNVASDTCQLTPINYGALYNWWAANSPLNITSAGWHIPTEAEIITLYTFLGGIAVAGGPAKEAGLTYWNTPNTGATNASGFNGRGSGIRSVDGLFYYNKQRMVFWTSTVHAVDHPYSALMVYNDVFLSQGFLHAYQYGEAVRPIKDSTTLTDGETGYYVGNDLTVYRTICIGTQEWVADSIIETKYRNGSVITIETDGPTWGALVTEAMCYYNNDTSYAVP